MAYKVDFDDVRRTGLESSSVADALSGLRAHEARYFWNQYRHRFVTSKAGEKPGIVGRVAAILERDLHLPHQAT